MTLGAGVGVGLWVGGRVGGVGGGQEESTCSGGSVDGEVERRHLFGAGVGGMGNVFQAQATTIAQDFDNGGRTDLLSVLYESTAQDSQRVLI